MDGTRRPRAAAARPQPWTAAGALLLVACTLLAAWLAPASAHADPLIDHDRAELRERPGASNGDGLVGPGEGFLLDQTLHASEVEPLTDVVGTLTSTSPQATISQPTSPWPDLAFGAEETNVDPFEGTLGAGVKCGQNVPFSLALSTSAGPATLPFSVPTGEPGPWSAHEATDVPEPVNDVATSTSSLTVDQQGRVKRLRVRIGQLTHPNTSDLELRLVAPDGTSVLLFDGEVAAANLTGTIFDMEASTSIGDASAPYMAAFARSATSARSSASRSTGSGGCGSSTGPRPTGASS